MADHPPPRSLRAAGFAEGETQGQKSDDVSQALIEEILAQVRLSLGRHGIPGDVRCEGNQLTLSTDPTRRRYNIQPWVRTWSALDEEARQRRAAEAVRYLGIGRAESLRPATRAPRAISIGWPLGILGVALVVGLLWWSGRPTETPGLVQRRADATAPNGMEMGATFAGQKTAETRVSDHCAATKARVLQGGTVNVADAEGWRVEIAIVRHGSQERLDTHPSLARYVEAPAAPQGSPFIWKEEPQLAALQTSDSVVQVRRETIGAGEAQLEGVVLSFGGTLVDPYFSQEGRARYHHIATSLSETLEATHSALYARCFDDTTHALGGWFRGLNEGGAAAALLYFMGTYAHPLHIAPAFAKSSDDEEINRALSFENIDRATRPIDRQVLATVVGTEGGMAIGKPNAAVIITFPFKDGNRASRTSRSLARVANLGR